MSYPKGGQRVWLPVTSEAGCQGAGFCVGPPLRRSFRRRQCENGAGRLGHSDPRLTLSIYAPVVESADREAAETVGAQFLRRRNAAE